MSSMLFKAKKYMASKMTETKSGRSLIVAHFGEAGETILTYLKYAARKFSDKPTARDLKKDMMKLIAKAVLLYTNKVVTAEGATPARGPTLACMACIGDALERAAGGGTCDVPAVAKSIKEAHDALLPLLKPHVREHNWTRLTRVLGYYGAEPFVDKLLHDADYEVERLKLCSALKRLTRPFETELRATSEFLARQLRSRADGLGALVKGPTLAGFLKHDVGNNVFGKWLQESDAAGLQLLEFAKAVEYYKSTANARLRPTRAAQIRDKFLDADGALPALNDASLAAARRASALATSSKPPPRDVFADLEAAALARLGDKFKSSFVTSAVFAELKKEHAALEARAAAAARSLKNAKSIEPGDDDDDDDDTIHHSDEDD